MVRTATRTGRGPIPIHGRRNTTLTHRSDGHPPRVIGHEKPRCEQLVVANSRSAGVILRVRPTRIVGKVALAPGTWPRPLLRAIRTLNKYLLNPVVGALAGRRNSYAAVIRHTGRKSGKQYSTPVGAERTQAGFVVPLAYGTRVDWLQNVLAAGRATISANGETHDVTEPELIDAATALAKLSPTKRRTFERIGIEQYLHVKLAEARSGPAESRRGR